MTAMTPRELLQAGRLREAILAQELVVSQQPGDADNRLFLCELYLFSGQFDTLRFHLDAAPRQVAGILGFHSALKHSTFERMSTGQKGTTGGFSISGPALISASI
jgi:protein involved in temperature-dependent protein secretion